MASWGKIKVGVLPQVMCLGAVIIGLAMGRGCWLLFISALGWVGQFPVVGARAVLFCGVGS